MTQDPAPWDETAVALRRPLAHDSGRVMNWRTYRNQIFGGAMTGLGYGLTEERRMDRQTGRALNANLHDAEMRMLALLAQRPKQEGNHAA